MLLIQQHLKNKVETPETLQERFGIHSKISSCGTMMIFDYDQIDSSKNKDHRLVREARGLVLYEGTWDIVAQSFRRFFNYAEQKDTEIFDWSNFSSAEKVDGSLMRLTCKSSNLRDLNADDSDILCFTRFSFANQPISDLVKETWSEMALGCLSEGQKSFIRLHPKYTFVFEFCSPYTQVVKFYDKPQMIMTGLFDNQTGEEVSINNEIYKQCKILFKWAEEYNFKSIDEILYHLDQMFEDGSSDEGFVIKDKNGVRLKLKNKFYLKIHKLSNNNNLANAKQLVEVLLEGEKDEILTYYPGLTDLCNELEEKINNEYQNLIEIWKEVKDIKDQKEFALNVVGKTNFSSILFNLKKEGTIQTEQFLRDKFYSSIELIKKVIL